MLFLTAAVVLVGALCLIDLLLTFGVIRRLREHTTTLEDLVQRGPTGGQPVAGTVARQDVPVGAFTAWTVDGELLSSDHLASNTVVVFLAPECDTCREQVPELVRWAADQDRERTLIVLDGQVTDPADLVAALNPVARVIVETAGTPVTEAFGATAFPSFCVVDGGKVTAASLDLARLPVVAARA